MTPEQFWAKVQKTKEGCWLWTAARDPNGYGRVRWTMDGKTRTYLAHRIAYLLLCGTLPDELDHVCRRPFCVNPAHLQPVAHAENMHRYAVARTHCRRGHEMSGRNVIWRRSLYGPGWTRQCRACTYAHQREYNARPEVKERMRIYNAEYRRRQKQGAS